MQTALIYAAVVLIWGSTWIMIKFQLGTVSPQASLVYRFALAAIALVIFGLIRGRRLRITRAELPMVATQGIFMFSANYYFVYHGTEYVTSGLVAVLFTSLVVMNLINERVFFGTPIRLGAVVASALSLAGIGMMFWPEVSLLSLQDDSVRGAGLILMGALMASFGNMAAISNTRRRLPVVAVNAHGMAIGAVCSAVFAVVLGEPFSFDWRFPYLGSLMFLAIPGTAIAFGLYLVLLDRIGAAKSAYTSVMLPVVALVISTLFEGYRWSALALAGLVIAVAGNTLALASKSEAKQSA